MKKKNRYVIEIWGSCPEDENKLQVVTHISAETQEQALETFTSVWNMATEITLATGQVYGPTGDDTAALMRAIADVIAPPEG